MIYLFHGSNPYLSRTAAREKFESLSDEFPAYESYKVDAEEVSPDELAGILMTSSMFARGKNIYLRDVYGHKMRQSFIDILSEYLPEHAEDPTFNLVLVEERKIPANTKYFKMLRSVGEVEESKKFNKRTFLTWAKTYLQQHGGVAEYGAVKKLAEYSNYDALRFVNSFERLELDGKSNFTEGDVESIVANTGENTVFQLIDALNDGDARTVMKLYDNLEMSGLSPLFILTMLARNIANVLMVKDLLASGVDRRDIPKITKLPPFTITSLVSTADKYSVRQLATLHGKLYNLDYQIKMGLIDPTVGLTLFLCVY